MLRDLEIERLLDDHPSLKPWLEALGGLVMLRGGVVAMMGLTREETIEFIHLDAEVFPIDPHKRNKEAFRRYFDLRERHQRACQRDAMENIRHVRATRH